MTEDLYNYYLKDLQYQDDAANEYYENLLSGATTKDSDYTRFEQLNSAFKPGKFGYSSSGRTVVLDKLPKVGYGQNEKDKFLAEYKALYNKLKDKYGASGPGGPIQYSYDKDRESSLRAALTDYNSQRASADSKKAADQKLEREARESTIANTESAAKNAYTQSRNQGLGSNLASSIGSMNLGDIAADAYQSNYGLLNNAKQSTQNDYLSKMGYVNSLEQTAKNMNTGPNIGDFLGGAGSGAEIGNSLVGGM